MSSATYVRYELIRVLRNRRFVLFSLGFPLVLYYLIAGTNRNEQSLGGSGISAPLYLMVSLAAFGTMNAVLAGGARIAADRSAGWTRQLRLTPLAPWRYLGTKLLVAYVTALITIVVLAIAGTSLGVHLSAANWFATVGLLRRQDESVVSIAGGEELTERQALQALLLPSANNIAAVLARWDAGSVDGFVVRMNVTARLLGMTDTRYTDPSGYDDATVSTARDQVRIVDQAMRLPVFASIVATPSATLPVTGTVYNTNTLLGIDGFVGVKTGSDDAAGGCFAFRAIRLVRGKRTTITGVVLGQPGRDRIEAGLAAADAMVDRIAGHRGVTDLPPG